MTWLLGKITSNPMVLLWIALAACAFGAASGGSAAWWVQGLRITAAQQETKAVEQEFTSFKQSTKEEGLQAKAENLRIKGEYQTTLKEIEAKHGKEIDRKAANAVANYRNAHPNSVCDSLWKPTTKGNTGGGAVSGSGAGIRMDDETQRQCVPDEEFIRECARDANKVGAFQLYCTRNHCPIED